MVEMEASFLFSFSDWEKEELSHCCPCGLS
jgi:hypothetical protein